MDMSYYLSFPFTDKFLKQQSPLAVSLSLPPIASTIIWWVVSTFGKLLFDPLLKYSALFLVLLLDLWCTWHCWPESCSNPCLELILLHGFNSCFWPFFFGNSISAKLLPAKVDRTLRNDLLVPSFPLARTTAMCRWAPNFSSTWFQLLFIDSLQ